MSDGTHRCCAIIYDTYPRSQCSRVTNTVECDGFWYCAQHRPEVVAAPRRARDIGPLELRIQRDTLLAACQRAIANIERWLTTGNPAGEAESQSIYDEMKAAVDAATKGQRET
jgi:hypothetical protein